MFNLFFLPEGWRSKARYLAKDIIGLDRAVSYSLLSKLWMLISTPVTLWLITTKFSSEIQGYYYTFNSLLLLQTFLELGFTIVLIQFISHEWAHLSFSPQMEIQGDSIALSRLASLVDLGVKWYIALSGIFFVLVGTSGYLFLEYSHTNVSFQGPWWLLCLAVSLNIILVPMRSFLEGSNRVYLSQQVYMKSNIVSAIAGWVAIYMGANLYAAAVISFSTALTGFIFLIPKFIPYWNVLKYKRPEFRISWRKDFWPQQWRIAVSWVSGFFMVQSFVPILFKLQGPVVAGQMGLTLQIYNAGNAISQSWTFAVAPQFGILGATKQIKQLKDLVKKTYIRSLIASIIFSGAVICLFIFFQKYNLPQINRFTDFYSIALFLVVLIAMQISNIETLTIRFQKREPFVIVGITSAIMVLIFNLITGKIPGTLWMAIAFAVIMIFYLIPMNHYYYKKEFQRIVLSN